MQRLIPLIVLALGACTTTLDAVYPIERYAIDADGRTYLVRAQYDPIERGWFARVELPDDVRLEPDDRSKVFDVVQNKLGPKVCDDGRPLLVEPEEIWSGHDAKTIRYLPVNGVWQLVGVCT